MFTDEGSFVFSKVISDEEKNVVSYKIIEEKLEKESDKRLKISKLSS